MDDMFTALENGHREAKRMLRELESSPSAASGANQDALARRKQAVDRLAEECRRQDAAEQECLWPAVRDLMANGQQMAEQGMRQGQAAQQAMDGLRHIDPQQGGFEEKLRDAVRDVRAHMDFKEQQVLPALRKVMDPQRAQRLGAQFAQSRKSAEPGRAQPHSAPRPSAMKAGGQAGGGRAKMSGQDQGRQGQGRPGQGRQGQDPNRQQEQQEQQGQGRQKAKNKSGR